VHAQEVQHGGIGLGLLLQEVGVAGAGVPPFEQPTGSKIAAPSRRVKNEARYFRGTATVF
jgi:hypothetical protein